MPDKPKEDHMLYIATPEKLQYGRGQVDQRVPRLVPGLESCPPFITVMCVQ